MSALSYELQYLVKAENGVINKQHNNYLREMDGKKVSLNEIAVIKREDRTYTMLYFKEEMKIKTLLLRDVPVKAFDKGGQFYHPNFVKFNGSTVVNKKAVVAIYKKNGITRKKRVASVKTGQGIYEIDISRAFDDTIF